MSTSQNVYLWKQKAEVDYTPLFVSLWLALNAWMTDRFPGQTDRATLELLKRDGHPLFDRFSGLLQSNGAGGSRFRGNLAELHRALDNARISYDSARFNSKTIVFDDCIVDWNNGRPTFGTILKGRRQQNKLRIDNNLWIDGDANRLYAVYIEIVYQIRCVLFHGKLPPTQGNERVIRQIYITLSTLMEVV